ncbi:MAG: CRISPR-associated endonuclease Cas1, partial [Deltaproteobacteria bacterium]
LTLRFVTPLQILRAPVHRKSHIFDQDQADAQVVLDRCLRSARRWFPAAPLRPGGPVELLDNGLLRADVKYPRKVLRGSLGTLRLGFPQGVGDHALPLVIAGLVGIGRSTNMGQGRYTIDELPPIVSGWPPRPAEGLLARSTRHAEAARRALTESGPTPGVDGQPLDDFLDRLPLDQGPILGDLQVGRVQAEPLRGILIRRPDGGFRPIAVPTVRERFRQRLVLEELRPVIDQLLEDASYAYRPGLGRRNAQAAVRKAYEDGFRWVLDGDIADFFDTVDWGRLRHRLEAWFGEDPVVEQLMAWVQAPIRFGGHTIRRERGLPQGTVVSPVLANLYLDAFDEALAAQGMRLVRYADDFVVLCRSREQAEAARARVADELSRLELSLHPDKTEVRSFDQGFDFLGSIFCRSLVFDAPARRRGRGPEVIEDLDSLRSDASALRALADSVDWLRELTAEGPAVRVERRWHPPARRPSPQRRRVVVVDHRAVLSGRRRGLWIERPDQRPKLIDWGAIDSILIVGGQRIRQSVIQRAMRERVAISFHRRDGRPTGLLLPEGLRAPPPTTRRQWRWVEESPQVLAVARALIEAKVQNTRLLLRRQGGHFDEALRKLKLINQAVQRAESAGRLRSLEGQAAHTWFSCWPDLLPDGFAWPGRSGRGAADPVNAMLNLLYSLLYRRCWLAALASGLDPFCGVLHQGEGRYAALAADLQEPFRFLADRVVLCLLHKGQVRPADFHHPTKGPFPCRIGDDAMRLIIEAWEEALHKQVAVHDRKDSYDRHIFHQAERLRGLVDGTAAGFSAFRMKW